MMPADSMDSGDMGGGMDDSAPMDKRQLIMELLKLAMSARADGLKGLTKPGADPVMDEPTMPGDPADSASGMPKDAMGDGEPDPEMLKKLLSMMGG